MLTEKRTTWYKEMAITGVSGCLYGGSSTLVGHPFDTIKTKMQAQQGHTAFHQEKPRYIDTIRKVYQSEGFKGFYKGWIPPFFGSILFRSLQFSIYEGFYTKGGTEPAWDLDGALTKRSRE